MSKTLKPLKIIALPPLDQWEEVIALMAQGHQITSCPDEQDLLDCDLLLGEKAHRMGERERKYLQLAIQEARRRKYGKETEESSGGSGKHDV